MPLYTPGNLVRGEVDTHCLLVLLQGIPSWVFDNIKTAVTRYENIWPEEMPALFRSFKDDKPHGLNNSLTSSN